MNAQHNTTELESKNLDVHVEKCALRYEQMQEKLSAIDSQFDKIDRRFDSIEDRMLDIEREFKTGQNTLITALIGATATIIAAFVGVITYML